MGLIYRKLFNLQLDERCRSKNMYVVVTWFERFPESGWYLYRNINVELYNCMTNICIGSSYHLESNPLVSNEYSEMELYSISDRPSEVCLDVQYHIQFLSFGTLLMGLCIH